MMTHEAVKVLLEWSFEQNLPVQEEFVKYYGSMHEYYITQDGHITARNMQLMIRDVEKIMDRKETTPAKE